jgi:hypothetical protein
VCNISLSDNATGAPKLNPFFAPVPKCTLCTRAGTSFVSFPPSPQLLPSARAKRTDMSAPRTAIFAAGVSPSSASLSLILWMRLAPGESIPGRLLYASTLSHQAPPTPATPTSTSFLASFTQLALRYAFHTQTSSTLSRFPTSVLHSP